MSAMEVRTFDEWQEGRTEREAFARRLEVASEQAYGSYERTRPRDADEARVLRSFGTPENLIGPTRL